MLVWTLLVSWLSVTMMWLLGELALSEREVSLLLVGVCAASALVYLGKGGITAWLGASAIGAGAFVYLSAVISDGLFSLLEPIRVFALAVIFTGIVLERVSPKPPLQPWMFMLIAAKAEFIIITSLMSAVLDTGHTLLEASVVTWWILVGLLLVSSVAVGLHNALLYKVVWWATLAISGTLLLVLVPLISFSSSTIIWAIAATIWPPLAVRLAKHRAAIG